ncbi:MAG: hypothetical protein JW881_20570 [Spirochaetales bacterium]|nr:hypothetical protein [Spirochaetales bacterium]
MNRVKILLRIAFGIGIIADAFMAIKLLILPYVLNTSYRPEDETVASLMLGWTILLIWAFIKPIERRFILLLTIIMMMIGKLADIVSLILGRAEVNTILQNGLPSLIILIMFIFLYVFACIYGLKEIRNEHSKTSL